MLPFELTKDTPYLALSGELWSVFYEYFNRNWSCYKGFLLYKHRVIEMWCSSCDKCQTCYMLIDLFEYIFAIRYLVDVGPWCRTPQVQSVNKVHWCAILIAHQIVMAKHGGSCVHFSGISTCGRTSRETVSHPQCPPLTTLCKISLPIYAIVTNKLLQPLTTTWYDSLVLSISLLKI